MNKRVMLILSCLLLSVGFIVAQTTRISGTVVDSNAEPVISASVVVKGTTIGTVTDLDGKFSINVPDGNNTLVFTLVGMKTVEARATQGMKVIMDNDDKILDEVIVVAYGTSKKEALTGSVSAISASDIVKRPVSNVGSALEGMGTGIQVSSSFGEPGQAPEIRIRGFSSMLSGAASPLIILDGNTFNGNIANINPNDIENISVLKDAASAALYGSRAASGVILITTKKAKKGESHTLSLNIRQGFTNRAMPEYERQNAKQYMQSAWTGYRNGLMSGNASYTEEIANKLANETIISDFMGYNIFNVDNASLYNEDGTFNPNAQIKSNIAGDLDWFKDMERTGYRQEYNISGSGAWDNFNVFYSLGYLNDKGYVKTSDYERYTGRINIEYSPRKWLNTGLNLSGSYEKRNRTPGSGGNSYNNVFYYARTIAPIYPVHLHDLESANGDYILDRDGNIQYDSGELYGRTQNLARHAIWESELNKYAITNNRTTIEPFAQISFLNDFKFLVKANMVVRDQKDKRYANSIIGDGAGTGRGYMYDYDFKEYTFSQQLNWAKTIGESHNFDVMAAHEYYNWVRHYIYAFKQGESLANNMDFSNFSTMNSLDGYRDRYRLESYLGRLRYNYDEKYFFEASYRRDGSSMFAPNNRWGGFWALGGSWIVSREAFLADQKWIDMLKVRASYGEVGNDTFGAGSYYLYTDLYALDFNGEAGAVYRSKEADKNVTWESMGNFTVGLDARLFNRVNFTFDYFDRRNKDLLFDVAKPLSTGSTNITTPNPTVRRNLGTVKNYGFEFSLDGDIIKTRDWRWNLGADITLMKNKIVSLPEQMKNGYMTGNSRWLEGKSRYELYVYQWAGVDQMTGLGLYELDPDFEATAARANRLVTITDAEGNETKYTTATSYARRDYSGSAIPDAFGSIKSSLEYKNFALSLLFTYGIGGKVLDANYASYMSFGSTPGALHKDALKAWTAIPEGMTETSTNRIDPKGVPALDYTVNSYNHTYASTRFLTDASYFTIKNVTLNYNVPRSFYQKLDLKGLSVGASVENLAIFSKRKGMDPQQSYDGNTDYQFVPARTFSFSLNVTL